MAVFFMFLKNRPRSGGIHQRHARRAGVRVRPFADAIFAHHWLAVGNLAVPDEFDHFGRRRDAHRQQVIPQQGIDEGGLTGVKFADNHHQVKHIPQILRHVQQAAAVLLGGLAHLRQGGADVRQQANL